jgi:hypothetical protein
MALAANCFRTWLNGNTEHQAMPDPPTREEAKPFVVRVWKPGLIPCNVLVFARDVEHAKNRVVLALEECCEKDYRGREGSLGRHYDVLDKLRAGEYTVAAEEFDTAMMPKLQWAGNGGL